MATRWKPSATVAAIIEQDGRFLLVEEQTPYGIRINNPAGHLDEGESLTDACVRETLEETMYAFEPQSLVGVYMTRTRQGGQSASTDGDITYIRFAFCGLLGALQPDRRLDQGILRTLWMTPDELRCSVARHRSPMVLQGIEDYLAGHRFDLQLLCTDASVKAMKSRRQGAAT